MVRTHRDTRAARSLAALALLVLAGPVAAAAQASGPVDQMVAESDASLEADASDPMGAARGQFFAGKSQLKRAEKLAAKAEKAAGAEREELVAKAKAELEAAVESFAGAIGGGFRFPDVYVSLGEALRALGRTEEALEAHATGLARDAKSEENFRGYVTTLLALERLGQAAAIHDQLRAAQPKRADYVFEALRRFHAARTLDPGGLAPADLDRLAAWLAERAKG